MKHNFFDLKLSNISFSDCVNEIVGLAKKKESGYLCAVNVHMTVEAQKDIKLKNAINNANWAVTDGMPVVWGYNFFAKKRQERIAGMDLITQLLIKANKNALVVSVYGNTEDNLNKFKTYITNNYKNIKIGTFFSPPFRSLTELETRKHIDEINGKASQILLVSLGCPKQEKWMFENKDRLNCVSLGIGNAINTVIGEEKRPQKFIRTMGMEWTYRLLQNPKRLFKRYLITNSKYCFMILKKIFL